MSKLQRNLGKAEDRIADTRVKYRALLEKVVKIHKGESIGTEVMESEESVPEGSLVRLFSRLELRNNSFTSTASWANELLCSC